MTTDNIQKPLILIAEDDEFFFKIYKSELSKQGYEVDVVHNGEEAIEYIKKRKPDLLLMDLIMPIKDGFDTLAELKSDKNLAGLNIIAFSSLGQPEDIQKAKSLGAKEYLIKKDMAIKDVVEKVKNFVGK